MLNQTVNTITQSLNSSQATAATCSNKSCLVLAGPGTGKTTTLVSRFNHLISNGINPQRVMAVTFTRKAADQLKARICNHSSQLSIGTFHSLAGRLLRPHATLVQRTSNFKIFDTHQQRGLLIDLKIFWNPEDGGDILEIISGAKEQLLSPEDFELAVNGLYQERKIRSDHYLFTAAKHFFAYEEALANSDACDFPDLIAKMVWVLENNETIRKKEAARYDHLLVDEFQDVNPAQIRFIDALLQEHSNLWVVGDDDQSIYGFRNADVSQTLNFSKKHGDAVVHELSKNYRSTPQILGLANNLITRNKHRHTKSLVASRPSGPKIVADRFQTPQHEADWIGDAVEKVLARGIPITEIAVLFRVGHISAPLQVVLSRKQIPFVLRGAGDVWESLEVRAFLGLLRLIENPRDKQGLYLLGTGKRGERLLLKAKRRSPATFSKHVVWAQEQVVIEAPYNATSERIAAWEENIRTAVHVAKRAGSLNALHQEIQAQTQTALRNEGRALVLSTIHSAKGLEWHTVFIAGFENGIIPHELAEDEEEERRLAYVAMTRCKRFLSISFSKLRNGSSAHPSPFLAEALNGLSQDFYDWRCKDMDPPRLGGPDKARDTSSRDRVDLSFVPTFSYDRDTVEAGEISRRAKNKAEGKPERTGLKWSAREDAELKEGVLNLVPLKELARTFKRSSGAIAKRLDRLNLVPGGHTRERYALLSEPEVFKKRRIAAITRQAKRFLGDEKALVWLNHRHPELDQKTPLEASYTIGMKKNLLRFLKEGQLEESQ